MHKVSIDRRRAQVIKSTTDEMERRLRCLRDLSRDSVDSGAQESKDGQSSDALPAELQQSARTASHGKEDPPIDEVARLMSEELKAAEEAAKKSVDDLRKNKELMEELRKIKTKKTSTKKEDDDEPDSDDSAEADAIVAKVLEEARLEELGDLQELGLDEGGEVGS
uniref:Putative membrane trafficking and cell signaling protein hrs n=1 Tax=Rhipicephalus microplus TaxID=6941 RepID=A0A6M2CRI3_RHIMP